MNKKVDTVQELKSERVQEELMLAEELMPAEEPIVLWLKSERVCRSRRPLSLPEGPAPRFSS